MKLSRLIFPILIVAIVGVVISLGYSYYNTSSEPTFEIIDTNEFWDTSEFMNFPPETISFESDYTVMIISAANDIITLTVDDLDKGLNELYEYLLDEKPTKQVLFEIVEN